MGNLVQDLRYSLRMLAKNPGFTAVAVLSLALGIGANTAIFTLINSLMLKALPVHDPQQLVSFGKAIDGGQVDGIGPGPLDIFPYDFYQQVQRDHKPLQDVCAFSSFPLTVSVRAGAAAGAASQASAYLVSNNFFSVLGAEPLLGRPILARDSDAPGSNPVAVVSYHYWQQNLGADPSAVGRAITINATQFTLIGVMPPAFFGTDLNEEAPDMWLPIAMQQEAMLQPSNLNPHGLFWLHLMGRRKDDVSIAQAQAWVTSQVQQFMVAREGSQISAARRQEIQKIYVELLPAGRGLSHVRDQYSQALNILSGVVALVLLIACANLANFMLAKAAARDRENSTRLALGASRWRLVRQMLIETLLLSLIGAAIGLVFAFWGTRVLLNFVVGDAKYTALTASPDWRVFCFTLGVSLLTGILFGIAPALRVSRTNSAPVLNATARTAAGSGGRSGRLLPKVLVTAQVVLSLVLLAGAGLFLRTLQNLQNQDFGFNRHNLLLVRFNAKFAGYKAEQLDGLYQRMLGRVAALPGVRSVTLAGGPPISFGNWDSPIFVRRQPAQANHDISTFINRVSDRYFETTGIPVLKGRPMGLQDTATSVKSVVVNQSMADYFFPQGDAIGHQFTIADPGVPGLWQIVGVVRDAKYSELRDKPRRMIYLPLSQLSGDDKFAYELELQTAGDPASVTGGVRAAMVEIDPNLPILDVKTITEQVELFTSNERLISELSTFFSLLALALACIGLFGVMSYNVVRRTNEIGIRIALGAQQDRVLWMVLRESLLLLGIGIALGIPVTLAATSLVRTQLFGLSSSDPLTLSAAVLTIAIVILAAGYIPARRAARVDPMVALRYE
jgi:predicted permease